MKNYFLQCLVFCAGLTVIPMIPAFLLTPASASSERTEELVFTEFTEPATAETAETALSTDTSEPVENLPECYRVRCTETGEILNVPVRDYLIGAVGAEMPVSFAPEALKAQVVAAHTYAERQRLLSAARGDEADFSDDPAQFQAFLTDEQMRERWGDSYAANYAILSAAVDAVGGELLTYENEPIIAAFHAMSGGKTESAVNVWGNDVAYLRSVDSAADTEAPGFEESVDFTPEEVMEKLTAAHVGLTIGGDASEWFGTPIVSEAGTVLELPAGDGIFTGQELRSIFGLRSADFTVSYAEGKFTFTTHGYGHSVGMSQYGANAMALAGSDYRDILAYYYPGTQLTQ